MAEKGKENIIEFPETQTFDESKAALDSVLEDLDEKAEENFGISAIFGTLMLPEREFALISEQILNEQEKSLNSVEDKMLMVEALNASGVKVEDFTKIFTDMCDDVEKKLKGKFSQQKIDFLKRFTGLIVDAINATEGIAKRTIPVAISFCHEAAKQPKYTHAGDAGMDVYACEDVTIKPGETVIIKTGIKTAIPLGYELQVRPRSGQSVKTKLRVANSPGTIDANYRDEIGVILENIEPRIANITTEELFDKDGNFDGYKIISIEYGKDYIIEKGQRFAQLVLSEKPMCLFYEVDDVKNIEGDRASGFGGSGNF